MALTMEIKVTKKSKCYYAEIYDGKILLGKSRQCHTSLLAKKYGIERMAYFEKKLANKPPKPTVHYIGTYRRPLDYDNKCYRIDPVTGERTVI